MNYNRSNQNLGWLFEPFKVRENIKSDVDFIIKSCNFSQRELARRVGVNNATVHGWVTGKWEPNLQHGLILKAMAESIKQPD